MIVGPAFDFCDNTVDISKNNFRNGCMIWIAAAQWTNELNNFSEFGFLSCTQALVRASYAQGVRLILRVFSGAKTDSGKGRNRACKDIMQHIS